ncbi:MAG TPA: thioesterase family protein [Acidimicrobiia bacterium]|nr:thioesterase family protein [Acidimicrobiia bacterium]
MGASHFATSTAVEPLGDGRYRADLGAEWNCPIVPHGGFVTATATRAMEAELRDESQRLRSITTVFAAQVNAGPVEIDVTMLRKGRSMSQLTATLRNIDATAGHTSVAVFGSVRNGFEFTELTPPPDLTPPEDTPSFRDPAPPGFERDPFPFWELVEGRPCIGHPPWGEQPHVREALRADWFRFDDPPRDDDGRWDPLAVLTMCDMMPGAVFERMGPEHDFYGPSADITVHMFGDAYSEWLLGVNRARHAGEGYASVDMEIWDMHRGEPALVAYATQMMFFTQIDW